ncbi:Hypothetical Protein FCC1311_042092 [Hondaea fermentalgiana]|uniref:Uncharacterized protein n=1 Tax=Hondaea fermentalgiana TaxID=2315210 RepID=A0A2R5GAD4_9STRA|nr:Hypothetical Protein FCC1311_042092 [Hondaea fermentalgiana]|eukprot:GBG27986.1 Hypothetical Protein FCC1311_042092 [Hondaea fermentalgiana]
MKPSMLALMLVALVLVQSASAADVDSASLRGRRGLNFVNNLPMYSPDCIRPTIVGQFPLCDPDNGPRCCIGLTCEPNPKDPSEYRCGDKAENKVGAGNTKKNGGDYDYAHIWSGSNMAAVFGDRTSASTSSSSSRVQAFHSVVYSASLLVIGVFAIYKVRGDVGVLADDLFDVKELVAGDFTFGALRTDGSALHWGYGPYGGDVGGLQNLQNVSKIFGGRQARAALFANGTLVCWGNRFAGGDCAAMKETFARKDMGLRKLVAHANAFAALSETGQVFVWGNPYFGGILPSEDLGRQLESNVIDVAHTETAFAAIKANGTVVIWGGLESLSGPTKLNLGSSFKAVYATRNTFIFVTTENELITMGAIDSLLVSDVEHVAAGRTAFAVLHVNGSVSSYGIASPESSTLTSQLSSDVIEIIVSGGDAFAAIKADRTLVTWGNAARGGDHSAVAEQVASAGGVAAVWANDYSFVAKLADEKGTLVAWGDGNFGGDASAVASHLAEGHIIDVVGGVDFWICKSQRTDELTFSTFDERDADLSSVCGHYKHTATI